MQLIISKNFVISLFALAHVQVKLATSFSSSLLERMVALTEALLATLGDSPSVEATTTSNNLNRSGTKLSSRAPDPEDRGDRKQAEILRFSSPVPDVKPALASPVEGMPAAQSPLGGQGGVTVAQRIRGIRQLALAHRVSRGIGGERRRTNISSAADSYLQVGFVLSGPLVCV